jgi:hypothetical protein
MGTAEPWRDNSKKKKKKKKKKKCHSVFAEKLQVQIEWCMNFLY